MITIALTIATGAFGLGLLMCPWRIVKGPQISDRILALDTLVINVIALLILLGMALGIEIFFEVAMLFALVGFVSTVAYCRFLLRGDIIE